MLYRCCAKATLQAIIRGKVALGSVIYSDVLKSYDGLVDVGYDRHFRIDHGNNEFAKGHNHINGIEGFLGRRQNPARQVQRRE